MVASSWTSLGPSVDWDGNNDVMGWLRICAKIGNCLHLGNEIEVEVLNGGNKVVVSMFEVSKDDEMIREDVPLVCNVNYEHWFGKQN